MMTLQGLHETEPEIRHRDSHTVQYLAHMKPAFTPRTHPRDWRSGGGGEGTERERERKRERDGAVPDPPASHPAFFVSAEICTQHCM
jgi:hypothetical protein